FSFSIQVGFKRFRLTDTTTIDTRQNEIDSKLSTEENMTATTATPTTIINSDDSLTDDTTEIQSTPADIEYNNFDRGLELTSEASEATQLLLEEMKESTTTESQESMKTPSSESTSQVEKATMLGTTDDIQEIREVKSNNQIESFVVPRQEDEEMLEIKNQLTTSKTIVQTNSSDEKISPNPKLIERAEALKQLRRILKAHMARKVLTLLNESKKRQDSQTEEMKAMASNIGEETLPSISGSECECECEQNDDVKTNDDDKVIAFNENLQRYVYTDKKDYGMLTHSKEDNMEEASSVDEAIYLPNEAEFSSIYDFSSKKPQRKVDESLSFSPPCVSCSLEGYEQLLNY
ncbi:CLUMA_CG007301, isoform A, partial [Clunio marinus]